MKVMPIRYVRDLPACERFYGALGLAAGNRQRNGHWMELNATGGLLGLHLAEGPAVEPAEPAVELSFVTDEPLETVRSALAAAGFESHIVDEAFGRSLRVSDPEGVRVQVNEHDEALYT